MDKKEKLTQIVKAVQKDKGQFELLYSEIIDRIYFWCYTIVGNEAEAKDATQEVMIRIYNKIDIVKQPEHFTSWMYRLARNSSLNYLRKRKGAEFELLYDEESGKNTESLIKEERKDYIPKEAFDLNETKKLVTEFVDNLPSKQRETITLYYLDEMKVEEIAKILECSVGTVKSRLHEGRKKLEFQINEYQDKHQVKLYNMALVPLLIMILNEYKDEICNKQDLHYEKNLYKQSKINWLKNALSNNLAIVTVATVVGVIALVVVAYLIASPIKEDTIHNLNVDELVINDVEMFNKSNKNPYVKSINYYTFPVRDSLELVIELKKDVDKTDIDILHEDEALTFEKNDNQLSLKISKNGKYTITIKEKSLVFEINNIDLYAPELVEVEDFKEYLKLHINDEKSQIDYQLSYVESDGKKYKIDNNLEVKGYFKGEVMIVLYINDHCYKEYFINIDK
ncbi:RNA polymerase sigma factor [Breznakia pachnodae]|uniref:RNA polymerase sigma factor (Sigma-70 family) n=1 Tax=Breznakia pachnodae TaxID=265178 RepID=A0ABU0E234_9FIRM|nr:RNA polymerase sigma factor [Breznakia pachnodae]MDQ0360952.1 RNA polymerase sigma factor (sigma-70 family) [Breznakia pachnodae]